MNNFPLIIVLALSAFTCAGCRAGSKAVRAENTAAIMTTPPRVPAVPVSIFEVTPFAHDGAMLIPAALSVEGSITVLALRDGQIMESRVEEGSRVAKNEIVLRFDDEEQRAALRQAELEVSRLKIEEQQYEALLSLNRSEVARERSLNAGGFSSKSDLERAEYKLATATSEREKTRLATATAQARVEALRLELNRAVVRSPIAGVVTRRHVNLGASVAKNDKLLEVSPTTPLVVRFQLPQTDGAVLAPGATLPLSLAGSDPVVARARVRRRDPVADTTSNTLGYLADVSGGRGLIPGMTVNLHLSRATARAKVWVPLVAFPAGSDLSRPDVAGTLFVVDDEACRARAVWIGTTNGDQVEILSGLAPGDRVILAPPRELRPGDRVEVMMN